MEALIFANGGKWVPARTSRPTTMKYLPASILGLVAIILIPLATTPSESYYHEPKNPQITAALAAGSDGDSLDVYLSRLAFTYECPKSCQDAVRNDRLFKIRDSNGLYSYGCLQFQEATWLSMSRRYGVDPWEQGGIANCDNQLKVARMMFEDDPVKAANHWYTSIYVRGLGLP